jgi:hypothetical protein
MGAGHDPGAAPTGSRWEAALGTGTLAGGAIPREPRPLGAVEGGKAAGAASRDENVICRLNCVTAPKRPACLPGKPPEGGWVCAAGAAGAGPFPGLSSRQAGRSRPAVRQADADTRFFLPVPLAGCGVGDEP